MSSSAPSNQPRPRLREYHAGLVRQSTMNLIPSIVREIVGDLNHDDGIQVSCISCMQFDETAEVCKKYGGRPPARVIAFGCSGYEDTGEVPF